VRMHEWGGEGVDGGGGGGGLGGFLFVFTLYYFRTIRVLVSWVVVVFFYFMLF